MEKDKDVKKRLAERKKEITELLQKIEHRQKRNLEDAIEVWKMLTEARGFFQYGEWLPWIDTNLPISQPTAFRYMQLPQST